jgi:secernin
MMRPWSCDTFVAHPDATPDGVMLFGKNSDRPAGECQPLRYWPRRDPRPGAKIPLAYVEVPEAEQAWAHLGASPYWCWGHELGLNEWGVAIGNEALFTRDLADAVAAHRTGRSEPSPGLLGMELVRLGLERATTATDAVTVMTDLVSRYGQWGAGVAGKPVDEGAYDNSYLIADPQTAWVLETSGRRWVARAITTGTYAISNQATIRSQWDRSSPDLVDHATAAGWWPGDSGQAFDFARAYSDPGTPLQASQVRLQRSRQLLAEAVSRGGVEHITAAGILRDHYEGTFLGGPYFSAGLPDFLTLCMHESPAGFTWGNTASSAIMHLPASADRLPHLWWAATTPCTSVYLPVFPAAGEVPEPMAQPAAPARPPRPEQVAPARFDPQSYWWQFQQLLDTITGGAQAWQFNDRQPIARATFDELEQRWRQQLPDVERQAAALIAAGDPIGRSMLAEFTRECAREALETCGKLASEFGPS